MVYDEELPIEDYIYKEPLKDRHEDIKRFKELIAVDDAANEDAAIELLYISKRLFYNHYDLDKIMLARNTMLHFFDVDTDDDHIPHSMNGGISEHDERIEDVLNAMGDMDELKKLNIKKLSNRYPEVPFFSVMKIIMMELQEEAPKKIFNQLEDALSIYPNDILLQLEKDSFLSRQEKDCTFISTEIINTKTASALFNSRKCLHSYELISLHTALYEYLVNQNNLLLLDALMFASQTLYPEWEDAWSEKEVYSEILKVQFCKLISTDA